MRRLLAFTLLATSLATSTIGQDFLSAEGPRKSTSIEQKLDAQVPLDLVFRDEAGRNVKLGDYIKDKPVILELAYFSCPMLCTMVLDGTLKAMSDMKLQPGKDYHVLTVSFDPRDTPAVAAEKKSKYVRRYGRAGGAEGWHFLTGDEASIRKLTGAVGFRYAWDPNIKQYAHGTATIVLTPNGRISKYIYGIDYPARDLRLALVEASQNRIGTIADQLLLLCYHYDPATGRYARSAMNVVRAGSVVTVLGLVGAIVFLFRKEKSSSSPK